MPQGFVLVDLQQNEEGVETLIFTDGMAFFSVFVEKQQGNVHPGGARRGATVAAMTRTRHQGQDYLICVVGEIPMRSARRIANSVRAQD